MDAFLTSHKLVLVLLASIGYAMAAIVIKTMAQNGSNSLLLMGLAVFFVLIVLAEVRLLRQMDLSNAYLLILGVETLLIVGYALWMGEGFSPREIAGGVMVLVGIMLVSA